MRCLLLHFVIFMSMRSAFKWPKITTSRLYQETLGTSQTRRIFHQRYQVSNCMCKKQHVCHYASAKGLETLKFDFQRPQRWLEAKCKKKKKTVRKPIKHSPSVQKETTYLMTEHILYYVFFAVFFFSRPLTQIWNAKLLLNYCHILQLESAITQYYITRKPFPGLYNILFAVRGCLHFKRAS